MLNVCDEVLLLANLNIALPYYQQNKLLLELFSAIFAERKRFDSIYFEMFSRKIAEQQNKLQTIFQQYNELQIENQALLKQNEELQQKYDLILNDMKFFSQKYDEERVKYKEKLQGIQTELDSKNKLVMEIQSKQQQQLEQKIQELELLQQQLTTKSSFHPAASILPVQRVTPENAGNCFLQATAQPEAGPYLPQETNKENIGPQAPQLQAEAVVERSNPPSLRKDGSRVSRNFNLYDRFLNSFANLQLSNQSILASKKKQQQEEGWHQPCENSGKHTEEKLELLCDEDELDLSLRLNQCMLDSSQTEYFNRSHPQTQSQEKNLYEIQNLSNSCTEGQRTKRYASDSQGARRAQCADTVVRVDKATGTSFPTASLQKQAGPCELCRVLKDQF